MGRVPHSVIEVIGDLVAFVLVLILLPFTLILFSPFYLWRLMVKILAKCIAPHRLDKLLSELDLFFLFNDPKVITRPEFVISICVTLEGEVDIDEFKVNVYKDIVNARYENGDLMYGRLQQKVTTWLGFYFFEWISDFDIENHVKGESNVKVMDESKHEFIASILRNPFPIDGGLWDVTLVRSLNRTFVNFRVHHVIGDGYSILKAIMTRGMKINPHGFIFPTKCTTIYHKESCVQKLCKLYGRTIGIPGKYIRENINMKTNIFSISHSPKFPSGGGDVLISTTGKIPLYKFKRTKLRLGVPFSAIVNSAISGALRNYLQKVESASSTTMTDLAAESINGIAFVPMPRHPNDAILNWCGVNDMKISLKGDTLDRRLDIANTQFKSTLTSSYGIAQYYYLKVTGNLPSCLAHKFISRKSMGLLYSNMPGPTAPGHLWNNFMSDVMFWDPLIGNNGIAISILSYNEYIKIGITANSKVIKGNAKLREIIDFIESELEKIFNLETV